jgi:hypothetical protein
MTKRICSGKIEALVELLMEKGIITKDEVMAQFKRLEREMKERGGQGKYFMGKYYMMDYCVVELIGKIGLHQKSCLDPPWTSLHISIRNRSISFLP